MSTVNIILSGVGGQGTILAAKLLAQAAMNRGETVKTAETIGMAQRGGSVVSHVRIGERIQSPLIPLAHADLIIGFEPAEAIRCLPYLRENGIVIMSSKVIVPMATALGKSQYLLSDMINYLEMAKIHHIVIDTDTICELCGSSKVSNVALLGAASKAPATGFTLDEIRQAIFDRVPEKFVKQNQMALALGAEQIK